MTSETETDELARANEKARKRKEVRDRMMSTKTVAEKGLLIVHTGKGKGKSTAAFGLAMRAIGHGLRVGVVQFGKGSWQSGERAVLDRFRDQVTLKVLGEGFTWETQDRARDVRAAERAWAASVEMIEASRGPAPAYDLVVLDELNIALRYEHLDAGEVVRVLAARPPMLHVVVTGRNAPQVLIDAADLVTEMTLVKHPFSAGVRAQKGIEF